MCLFHVLGTALPALVASLTDELASLRGVAMARTVQPVVQPAVTPRITVITEPSTPKTSHPNPTPHRVLLTSGHQGILGSPADGGPKELSEGAQETSGRLSSASQRNTFEVLLVRFMVIYFLQEFVMVLSHCLIA